ncbi:MAG TPA: glycosyl hydrolase [Verrucomicrobiae bacterium]
MNTMRGRFFVLAVLGLVSFAAGWPAAAADSDRAKALFRNPPREYSTGPLWVWNDLLTEAQVRDTLRDLAAQKIKQVWVHPRPGLMTPYLSEEWFRLWEVSLEEAKRLDMNVWIYDENSYPSGFAGGLVPEAMPESRGRGLALKETESAPKWGEDTIGVYRLNGDRIENVTAAAKGGEALEAGRYLVASQVRSKDSPWHGNRCYVNLLSPGVTEKFLDLTLEPYRRELGREFGRRIPGVFTDEPNIRPAGGLPWSETLAEEFQKRWRYDLLDHLPSLGKPVGDWQKVRHNYYAVLNEQFIEHWAKPYHDYCEKNHLQFTGHYWDHDWPDCVGVPDNMAMYAWHQWPAIDCLMNQYAEHTHAQFGNARMVKELSSIANQLGRKRTLCEVYGAGGWDLRFEDMKRIGDWLEVLGVNMLNQHLSYVTIRGARKRDHPQSFSYHEPWWEAYHISAGYFARLSAALSQGEQINRVLLLEPTTTAWMYQGDEAKLRALGEAFFKLIMELEAAQVEYDIGCEDVIARHGKVVTGSERPLVVRGKSAVLKLAGAAALEVGARAYSTIVIPPLTENLNGRTVELLRELLESKPGGEVLCAGEPPGRIDGAVAPGGLGLANNPFWTRVEASNVVSRLNALPGRDLVITRATNDKGKLFHHRRTLDDGELLFLVNTSSEERSAGWIESGMKGAENWDLYRGEVKGYAFESSGSSVRARFDLPPSGSLLLFLSEKSRDPSRETEPRETMIAPLASPEVRRLEPNILTLDFVDVTAGGETRTNVYFYQGNQFAWKKNGMERNPWDSAVQFKDELISKRFPESSGFRATYRFTIAGAVPEDLAIVVERPDLYTITCNGRAVLAAAGRWWLDKAFGVIPLERAAQTGENEVTIQASPFRMFHEIEPAYVLGSFGLETVERGFVIGADRTITPGSTGRVGWNEQGHPFYGAGVSYRERFEVKAKSGRYKVVLPDWLGSIAKVTVNGKAGGFIDAQPYECEVTKQIRAGRNDIEVTVVGTLKNTLGPHHGNPKLGAAWPSAFQQGPEQGPPPGRRYSTVGYGLFEPFLLKRF